MTYREEMVSADPGPNVIPETSQPNPDEDDEAHQSPVVGGVEAEVHDPDEAEPREDAEQLVGERPALGSVENPG